MKIEQRSGTLRVEMIDNDWTDFAQNSIRFPEERTSPYLLHRDKYVRMSVHKSLSTRKVGNTESRRVALRSLVCSFHKLRLWVKKRARLAASLLHGTTSSSEREWNTAPKRKDSATHLRSRKKKSSYTMGQTHAACTLRCWQHLRDRSRSPSCPRTHAFAYPLLGTSSLANPF